MDNLIKDVELVDVAENDGKITLTFLDGTKIYEVNWNKKVFDNTLKTWSENEDKEKKVEEWSKEYFKTSSDKLSKKIGTKHDIYVYDTYCSMWETQNKFTSEDNGKSFRTTIEEIVETPEEIQIYYRYNDKKYMSKMSFMQKIKERFYLNPIKERKQKEKFQQKFGVPIDKKDELIGQEILVKVRSAFGSYYYGEVDML